MVQRPTIVAASFRGLEAYELLDRLGRRDSRGLHVLFIEDRVALIRTVIAARPTLVLFPAQDAEGESSLPLISRLQREAPSIVSAVLLKEGERPYEISAAIRSGAEICYWNSERDLHQALSLLIGSESSAQADPGILRTLLEGIHPERCMQVLLYCIEHAHLRLRVDDVAAELRVSRRSLSRWMGMARWPTPSEVIDWGCLVRASVIQWKEESSEASMLRAAGFKDTEAFHRVRARLLRITEGSNRSLTPHLVTTRLRWRLDRLGKPAENRPRLHSS